MRSPHLKSVPQIERALLELREPDHRVDIEVVAARVLELRALPNDARGVEDLLNDLDDVLKPVKIAHLCLDFVDSTHGDGLGVEIYFFPGRTVLLKPRATYEIRAQPRVLAKTHLEAVVLEAEAIFTEALDGTIQDDFGDWDDEDYEAPEGSTVRREGMAELRLNWRRVNRPPG